MINRKTEMAEFSRVVSVTCDCCKKEFTDILDTQEFLHIDDIGGYCSAIGDEDHYVCDLCSCCVKQLLGKYLRIIPRDIAEKVLKKR